MKRRLSEIEKTISELADLLPQASATFVALLQAPREERGAIVQKLHDLETQADGVHDGLINKVTHTFITPFDREDLYRMLTSLDDTFDRFDETGHLLVSFDIEDLPEDLVRAAQELEGMCEQAVLAVPLIKHNEQMDKVRSDMKKHEHELDRAYAAFLTTSLVPGADPIAVLKLKIIADTIVEVSVEVEAFARALRVMSIKET